MDKTGTAVLAVLLLVVNAAVHGLILSYLWGWFMVPLLGLPELLVSQAIGISMTVKYMTYQWADVTIDDPEQRIRLLKHMVIHPPTCFIIGWIVNQIMVWG